MPSTTISRRHFSPDLKYSGYALDTSMKDATSLLNFDDGGQFVSPDPDQMLFGPLDMDDGSYNHESSSVPFPWDSIGETEQDIKPFLNFAGPSPLSTNYEFGPSLPSPTDSYYDSSEFYTPEELSNSPSFDNHLYFSNWVKEELPSPSSPISIPSSAAETPQFVAYGDSSRFPLGTFSPTEFAALHPLPSSASPSSSFEDHHFHRQRVDSISPRETSLHPPPQWATQLWDSPGSAHASPPPRSPLRHDPLSHNTQRLRIPSRSRRDSIPSSTIFQSSSAPSFSPVHSAPGATRSYSRRAESVSVNEDHDATVRRKRKISVPEELTTSTKASESSPLKSVLRPPKLAPSAWQLYFTDWIQRQQASNTRKLNVAQAAKEAGQEYACLSTEEKEPYKRRSQAMKEAREREFAAYMRTLTPEDIKRENTFRAAQRKAGKSRKSNIKDPNAPKKPLSAYFMFLQRIRANPHIVQEIFGDETETTRQSVLAAAKWRSMTDDERKPYLAQAEQEKMEYEAARRLYEEGTTGFGTSINFSIFPGSPSFRSVKVESESESEGLAGDDVFARYIRS